jgi:hypothetical protein
LLHTASHSNTDTLAGIVEQLSQEFLCKACGFELRDPVRLLSCGHVFCRTCVTQGDATHWECCPYCYVPVSNQTDDYFISSLLEAWKEFRQASHFLLSESQGEDPNTEASSCISPKRRRRECSSSPPINPKNADQSEWLDGDESKTPSGPRKAAFSVANFTENTVSSNSIPVHSILETPHEDIQNCNDRTLSFGKCFSDSPQTGLPKKSLGFDDNVSSSSDTLEECLPSFSQDIDLEQFRTLVYELNDIVFRISRVKRFST